MTRIRPHALKIICALALVFVGAAFAAPAFSGEPAEVVLEKDTEWSGVVTPKGNVTVRTGVELRLKPGTEVVFGAGEMLLVNGSVVAEGTAQKPITFRAAEKEVRWGGILIGDTTVQSKFSHVKVLGASKMGIGNASLAAVDSSFESIGKGIHFLNGGQSLLQRCRISGSDDSGLSVETGSLLEVVETTIEKCRLAGIMAAQNSSIRVLGTTVTDCETGIVATGNDSIVESCTVKRCKGGIVANQAGGGTIILKNTVSETEIGIYCLRFSSPRVYANTITKSEAGIKCFQKSNPEIENNRIEECDRAIECLQMCSPVVKKNSIVGNKVGIYLHLSSYAVVNQNNLDKNSVHFELDNMSADWEKRATKKPVRSEQARNTQMSQLGKDTQREIEDDFSHAGTIDARENWWGEATTAEMKKGGDANVTAIKDFFDVPTRTYEGWEGEFIQDKVDYSGFLPSPIPGADPKGFRVEDKR